MARDSSTRRAAAKRCPGAVPPAVARGRARGRRRGQQRTGRARGRHRQLPGGPDGVPPTVLRRQQQDGGGAAAWCAVRPSDPVVTLAARSRVIVDLAVAGSPSMTVSLPAGTRPGHTQPTVSRGMAEAGRTDHWP